MPEDHTNLKDNAKEQVLAAIQTLRAKGAEINPYTVANEGGVPRSTIYRNAELMELISREKAEPAEKLAAKDAGYPDRVAELEAQVEELGQTIWNLEKQNEDLQKDFSDAWTMGFAAGLEEANKRHAKGIKADTPTPVTATSAWPSVERNATTTADNEIFDAQNGVIITPAPQQTDFSGMPGPKDVPAQTLPVITPVTLPVEAPNADQTALASENAGAIASATATGTVNSNAATGASAANAAANSHPTRHIDQAESGTFNAAAAPIKNSQNLNSLIDFSTAAETANESTEKRRVGKEPGTDKIILADPVGEENDFAYFGDEVVLGQEYLYSEELLKEAESILFGGVDKPAGTNGGKKEVAAEPRPVPADKSENEVAAPNYTLDFSQAPAQAPPAAVIAGSAGLESGVNIGAIAAAVAVPAVESKKATPAADVFAAQQAYNPDSGIYNVARSGPYVASEFNPLIELSWKDIEDVYNYRASTLKDYARNVPSAPNKLGAVVSNDNGSNGANKKPGEFPEGEGLVDASILAMLPTEAEIQNLQELDTAVYMSEEVADVVPEGPLTTNQDPDATGDRMQAMMGYKPDVYANRLNIPPEEAASQQTSSKGAPKQPPAAFDSEGIVDLDALDIFENLDEWIDLDRLERGEDPFGKTPEKAPATAAKDAKTDELAELIKKRIEQASEIAPEAAPGARGLGLGKPATHPGPQAAEPVAEASGEAAQPRARNKFIGGKASSGDAAAPAASAAPFVKAIPPEIRKACLILGVRSEDMTTAMVVEAWKKQIVDVHPDKGGDTETAIILNTAKDTLVHWIDAQAPKLGKKFGGGMSSHKDKDKDKG